MRHGKAQNEGLSGHVSQ